MAIFSIKCCTATLCGETTRANHQDSPQPQLPKQLTNTIASSQNGRSDPEKLRFGHVRRRGLARVELDSKSCGIYTWDAGRGSKSHPKLGVIAPSRLPRSARCD